MFTRKEPELTEQAERILALEEKHPSAYALWKKASDQAYSAQNVPSIVLLVALGVLLYFSEDVPWVHVYQIPMILVALVIVVAVHWGAAKFRLGQVWRCPHCHEALPIHKGVDKGDTKWMPDESVSVCPHCQKNL